MLLHGPSEISCSLKEPCKSDFIMRKWSLTGHICKILWPKFGVSYNLISYHQFCFYLSDVIGMMLHLLIWYLKIFKCYICKICNYKTLNFLWAIDKINLEYIIPFENCTDIGTKTSVCHVTTCLSSMSLSLQWLLCLIFISPGLGAIELVLNSLFQSCSVCSTFIVLWIIFSGLIQKTL